MNPLKLFLRWQYLGTEDQRPGRARQAVLANQLGMLGALATAPYQLFYIIYDLAALLPLILLNVAIMATYLSALPLNAAGRHDTARNMALTAPMVQVILVTAFLSTGAGVHLFYFSLACLLPLAFSRERMRLLLFLLGLTTVLLMLSHLLFPPGRSVVTLPEGVLRFMYAGSMLGVIALTGGFAFLYRREIDRAEAELSRTNRHLATLSARDPLTGVANRRGLDLFLQGQWELMAEKGKPLAVLMCDVDHFKTFNDDHGHKHGDVCLRQVAEALTGQVRRDTDLVARYGGEEFTLVLPATDLDGATRVAEACRRAVAGLGIRHGGSLPGRLLTVSVGVSVAFPAEQGSVIELVHLADEALYQAKDRGRDQYAVRLPGAEPVEEMSNTAIMPR
ncbi:MAG: diguanylate cyclase [Ectothiorhodospiraceae bacterium]|nr:diguanylate cyclase [Ectothiorhodospiraceae bacterium]MCH8502804.1 diguanylate cyclase [Ectothiorhodospiraceae bacterium]